MNYLGLSCPSNTRVRRLNWQPNTSNCAARPEVLKDYGHIRLSWIARLITRFAHMTFTATSAGKVQVRSTRTVTRFWSSRVDDVALGDVTWLAAESGGGKGPGR